MNTKYKERVKDFLEQQRFAVLGYSSDPKQAANIIYRKLEDEGYKVFAVNPKAHLIPDLTCYPDIGSIPENVEVAVLCTPKEETENAVVACANNGIRRIWIHEGIVPGSYSRKAHVMANHLGMDVIPGGCPIMFLNPDILHKCFRWLTSLPESDHL